MKPNGARPDVLVVDLDGTLLRSDMLHESFWSAFAGDWRTPVLCARALLRGRAALKRHLAAAARLDAARLPYDDQVIAHVQAWRADGGRAVLVTASDETIARAIAGHLGLFDEVHGSDGRLNLKGQRKAAFLEERFGADGFAYMGDSPADVPVWKRASKAITVNAPATLRRDAERVADDVEHLATAATSIRLYAKALRPHQWLKNTLVFLPMLAAHQLDVGTFALSLLAFVAFSLVASSVYVLNDLLDLAADRAHPRKRERPFASGSIPIAHGTWLAAGLFLLGAGVAVTLGWAFFLVMLSYYILTTAYSLYLKRLIVIDICVLAGLYTLRIVAGGMVTELHPTVWLLAFSMFLFLSLASVKRQAELVNNVEDGTLTPIGRGYHVDDLPIMSMISITSGYLSVLVMALYLNSPSVLVLYKHPEALWGICCVLLFWITRTVMITHRGGMHDDPVVFASKDRTSRFCAFLIALFASIGAIK